MYYLSIAGYLHVILRIQDIQDFVYCFIVDERRKISFVDDVRIVDMDSYAEIPLKAGSYISEPLIDKLESAILKDILVVTGCEIFSYEVACGLVIAHDVSGPHHHLSVV